MSFVFVYGTLMTGESNHCYLEGSRYVGCFRTQPQYNLLHNGYFPMLVEGKHRVQGELFACSGDTLITLDRLEGHPVMYERTPVMLEGCDFVPWAYIWQRPTSGLVQVLNTEEQGALRWTAPRGTAFAGEGAAGYTYGAGPEEWR